MKTPKTKTWLVPPEEDVQEIAQENQCQLQNGPSLSNRVKIPFEQQNISTEKL